MFGLWRLSTAAKTIVSRTNRSFAVTPLRTSADAGGWSYRFPNEKRPKLHIFLSEGIMALMWYWILFHLWYDSGHLIGEYPYPDPSKWTDKELGIPPLEED